MEVYLIHWDHPDGRTRHYTGYTSVGVEKRFGRHAKGYGCATTRTFLKAGYVPSLARVWGDSAVMKERKVKNSAKRYCPLCKPTTP